MNHDEDFIYVMVALYVVFIAGLFIGVHGADKDYVLIMGAVILFLSPYVASKCKK